MENIERVDVVDGYEDLHKHLQDVFFIQKQTASLLDKIIESTAWCVFHDNHHRFVLHKIVEVGDDIRVLQHAQDFHFGLGCLALVYPHFINRDLFYNQK